MFGVAARTGRGHTPEVPVRPFFILLGLALGCSDRDKDAGSGDVGTDDTSGGDSAGGDSAGGDDSASGTDQDRDGVSVEDGDCDDEDGSVYPGADEACDGVDNDCDEEIDEGLESTVYYPDADSDGYGAEAGAVSDCAAAGEGYVASAGDCDDGDGGINPAATERCDGADNDCDGLIDDADDGVEGTSTWYSDGDGDGYGADDGASAACEAPEGSVALSGDCDDADAAFNPGASEDDCADPTDYNCDGSVGYEDADGDGYAACEECDDGDAAVNPDADERCDDVDNDCDGAVDEADASDAGAWYTDADEDGFGDPDDSTVACDAPAGAVADATDCDDGDGAVNPDADERCDDLDNDCDGAIDEADAADASAWYTDADDDGYGDPDDSTVACDAPAGAVADASDCDDGDSDVNPDGLEVCDGADNDCDGATDGVDAWWDPAWPYRQFVTVTGGAFDVQGPPVAPEIDFAGALDAIGVTAALDPDTIRVVLQDCARAQPEIPSQYLDEWAGLFEKAADGDGVGDGHGSVAFLYDEDGDYSALETLAAGASATFAVYFGGAHAAPDYLTDLSATGSTLSGGPSTATFSASAGGLLSGLTLGDSVSLMSQATSCCGNSIYTSGWTVDPQDDTGTLTLLEEGPVFAAIEASGSRSNGYGAYDYSYVYWMFSGRPELWSKVYEVTTAETTLAHTGDFTNGIRPWESRSDNISGEAGTVIERDTTDFLYADVSDGGVGVAFGYVQAPEYVINLTASDPYLIAVSNDYADAGSGTPGSMASGTAFFDHVVMVVVPHEGVFADVDTTLFGLMEGATVEIGAAEGL